MFQNQDDRAHFLARGLVPAGKSAVLPGSGVPTDLFDPARISDAERQQVRASLGVPAGALLVTMVARVMRAKGVADFVAAAREVRQCLPGSHFLLVGPADRDSVDGFSTTELAAVARAVTWPGARPDVPAILAASDLFVLPSYLREGTPRALLEAAAMALPLITTDMPGCNAVVEDGVNGFVVPARDPAALAGAIVRLGSRPDLRRQFGLSSRQRVVERFALSVIVSQTRRLYEELLARKAAAPEVRRLQGPVPQTAQAAAEAAGNQGRLYRAAKRSLDVVLAAAALVLTGPLVLLGALAVKLSSRGPAFYPARRAGLRGRRFVMFKLRTMRVGAERPDRKVTEAQDERVTPVGRLLRKLKVDELPQFWNVLRGDMSIIGPRPEDWDIVRQYYTAQQRRVLEVRPGLASLADVRWYPDLTYHDPPAPGVPIQEHYVRRHLPVRLAEDLRYVERQGLLLDFQVLLRLVFCVLVRSWIPPRKQPLPLGPEE